MTVVLDRKERHMISSHAKGTKAATEMELVVLGATESELVPQDY